MNAIKYRVGCMEQDAADDTTELLEFIRCCRQGQTVSQLHWIMNDGSIISILVVFAVCW
jgi:hypothetical protein